MNGSCCASAASQPRGHSAPGSTVPPSGTCCACEPNSIQISFTLLYKTNNNNVRIIYGAPLYDKVSSRGRFTILDIVGADFSVIYREAHMLLDLSGHPLNVAMHNLLTPAKTFAGQLDCIGRS